MSVPGPGKPRVGVPGSRGGQDALLMCPRDARDITAPGCSLGKGFPKGDPAEQPLVLGGDLFPDDREVVRGSGLSITGQASRKPHAAYSQLQTQGPSRGGQPQALDQSAQGF